MTDDAKKGLPADAFDDGRDRAMSSFPVEKAQIATEPTPSGVRSSATPERKSLSVATQGEPTRPSLGPPAQLDDTESPDRTSNSTPTRPLSPYSAAQAARRNLTMPPVPNFNVPDSPPGSPPHDTTKKFEQFLELKKKGVHFNQRLADSTALRNPSLFQKLMAHAGLDETSQYASALPQHLAVPTRFPPWAYGESLNRAQEETRRRREEEKKGARKPPDFVPASREGTASRDGTPGGSRRKGEERSARGSSREDREAEGVKRRKLERR